VLTGRPAESAAARPVVVAACLVTTLVPLGSTSVAVALPQVREAFGADVGRVLALVTAYLVVTAACQPVAGALGDRWGRRRSCLLGVCGFGAASALAALAPTLAVLVVLRCLQAGSGALALVNAAALVRTTVPGSVRGRAFGAIGASATAAAAAGPVLGGAAVSLVGWRGAFLVGLPLVAVAGAALVRSLPPDPPAPAAPARFDARGALLLLVVLGGGATLLSESPGLPVAWTAGTGALLVAAGAWFVRHELAETSPVLDVRVFRVRGVVAAGAAVATGNAALYTALLAVPFLVGSARAVPLLLALLVGASATSWMGGRLSDRWGRRRPAVLGGLVMTGASVALVAVDPADRPWAAGALLAACGVGQGLAAAAVQAAGLEALPPERAGLASGVWSTCRYLGSITGSSLLALLVAGGSGAGVFALAAVGGALSTGAAAALPVRAAEPGSPAPAPPPPGR
jgi:DHA2 family methylenomycin A resistance protein-like MFS transporter